MPLNIPFVGHLLRVITPEEINELTTNLDVEKRQSLTMLIEKGDAATTSEESDKEQKEESFQLQTGKDVITLLQQKLPFLSVNSFSDIELLKQDPFVVGKIKESVQNSKQIISFYKQSAEINVKQEKKDGPEKLIHIGVLVNKKQS